MTQLSSFIDLKQDGVLAVRPSTQGRFQGHHGAKHPEAQRDDQKPELANSQKGSICRGFSLEVFIHLHSCFGSLVPSISRSRNDLSFIPIWKSV